MEAALRAYSIDRTRLAVHGYQGGGSLAYLVGFAFRDVVRGVAAVGAALPPGLEAPDNDPVYPLVIYSAAADATPAAVPGAPSPTVRRLRNMKYPVTTVLLGSQRYLNGDETAALARWIDVLDRI